MRFAQFPLPSLSLSIRRFPRVFAFVFLCSRLRDIVARDYGKHHPNTHDSQGTVVFLSLCSTYGLLSEKLSSSSKPISLQPSFAHNVTDFHFRYRDVTFLCLSTTWVGDDALSQYLLGMLREVCCVMKQGLRQLCLVLSAQSSLQNCHMEG